MTNSTQIAPAVGQNIICQNLRQLMRQQNITEAELARQTMIPQPTLHKVLTGTTADPRISTLLQLATYFKISVDELCKSKTIFNFETKTRTQIIPIISWQNCVKGKAHLDTLRGKMYSDFITTAPLTPYAYGLVSKPSMEPHFPRNSLLIVCPDTTPSDGDLVVVHYRGSEEATLRELVLDGPQKQLLPISQTGHPHILDENVTILGVLMQSMFLHYKQL